MTREYEDGPGGRVMLPHFHYTTMTIEEAQSSLSTRTPIHITGGLDADDGELICPGNYEVVGWGRHPTGARLAMVELKEVADESA